MKKPLALIIMDGFGINNSVQGNAIEAANTPNLDRFFAMGSHTQIGASGLNVGLPDGQMGNSEVGHTNIGAGRVVYQELTRITKSIQDGDFFENPALKQAMEACRGKALHLMGLLSDGGVHSHNEHLYGLLEMAKRMGLDKVYVHCFMDGRDVPPSSGKSYVEQLMAKLEEIGSYAFYNCRTLAGLELPEGVRKIGAYAFYNCRNMEKINIPLAAAELNTGLFLNCDRLREIAFGQCRHISDLISVLNHELWLTIDFPQTDGDTERARLILPDFQYEYIEDTPARQFHQVNYGTGHIFRQCVGNSEIDFRRYDEIFYLTRREDAAATVLLLAVSRLEYPYKLGGQQRENYLDYIRGHLLWAAEYFMEKNEPEKIRLFADWGLFTAENLPEVLAAAQKRRKTEIASLLMDYQHKHFGGKKKKTFEL